MIGAKPILEAWVAEKQAFTEEEQLMLLLLHEEYWKKKRMTLMRELIRIKIIKNCSFREAIKTLFERI